MKRGLKATHSASSQRQTSGYNPCPDEKGTESSLTYSVPPCVPGRYNPCPDEKGTESCRDGTKLGNPTSSYNPCPDEKGTESNKAALYGRFRRRVTILAPMKRGLKVIRFCAVVVCDWVTILDPMKRGLKDLKLFDKARSFQVTILDPMKRGLKVCNLQIDRHL